MYTIKTINQNEITIKNSKFIGLAFPVGTESEIKKILEKTRNKYKDATHIVYAYKLINSEKYSDDKEPSGSAGLPVMEIINKKKLINVLVIVIRYFGGTKLGLGGLIRAYSKTAKEVLPSSTIEKYIKYNYYLIRCSYDNLKLLNNMCNNLDIIEKNFKDQISYKIKIKSDEDNINNLFKNTKIIVKQINK